MAISDQIGLNLTNLINVHLQVYGFKRRNFVFFRLNLFKNIMISPIERADNIEFC